MEVALSSRLVSAGLKASRLIGGKQIPPEKVRAWDLPAKQRARIQPTNGSGLDSWFRFDRVQTDDFTPMAELVILFLAHADKMLDDFDHVLKLGEHKRPKD